MTQQFDIVIVGAGIIGLTLARELALQKAGRIVVIEKEAAVGQHASGRNSGVAHAGIYYPPESLKSKFCLEGHRLLLEYVDNHQLPVLKCGKVIVASTPERVATLTTLLDRATKVGASVKKVSLDELRELEPLAHSHEFALWSPKTAVIDSKAVLNQLTREIAELGVTIIYGEEVVEINPQARLVETSQGTRLGYGFLYNTAGVYADRVAHWFDVGRKYRIMPFKGLYWKSSEEFENKVQRLIYPAPDVRMPFLGVHITRTVDGHVLFGPTAIPAFGRENYSLIEGLDPEETPAIGWHLLKMLAANKQGFRNYVSEEMSRYLPKNFFTEAQSLAPSLKREDIGEFYKVGIRAQLMDLEKNQLEMDFVVEKGEHSLHVLNAISPAFTSSFAMAEHLAKLLK